MLSVCVTPLLALGCQPSAITVDTEHVSYSHSDGLAPCGGTVSYSDAFAVHVLDFLELGFSSERRVEYSWLDEPSIAAAGLEFYGCQTRGERVLCKHPAATHEIVHSICNQYLRPLPNAFFAEGLAVSLEAATTSNKPIFPGSQAPLNDPLEQFTANTSLGVDYSLAASFTSFLLYKFGPESFARFYSGIKWNSSKASVSAAFLESFDIDVSAAVEEFNSASVESVCGGMGHSITPFACHGEPIPWLNETTWSADLELSCSSEDVVGGQAALAEEAETLYSSFVISVENAGNYSVKVEPRVELNRVYIRTCSGCPFERGQVLSPNDAQDVYLDAGEYFINVDWAGDSNATASLSIVSAG